jgi:signal transduction histidine kinase/DNA-binding response OmpR family regulator
MKTLLVQDVNRGTVLRDGLRNYSQELTTCPGRTQAQDALAHDRFALVVVDLGDFSELEGFSRWLNSHSAPHGRLVVAALGASDLPAALPLLGHGVDDLLIKPFDPEGVRARLASIEHQLKQRAQSAQVIDSLNTRAQQQVAVAALGQCALSEELSTLIAVAGRFIVDTLQVECWGWSELDGPSLRLSAGFGWPADFLGHSRPLPPPESITGRTLRGEDLLSSNLSEDPRFPEPDFVSENGIRSALSVAVKGKLNEVFGVLGGYTTRPGAFVEDELRFLEGLANVLGAAIERQRHDAEIQKHQSQVQHLQRLESVGQLAAGLAHDYNNVLTVIHGHVTLSLGDPQLPAKTAASLKVVLEAVERAANLTRQMLSFSRKQSLQPQTFDLNAAVATMARLLDKVLGRNVNLKVEPSPAKPLVHADPGMLDQVLMNLAVNSRDAMPKGGTLHISTARVRIDDADVRHQPDARPGNFACLKVTDTGCGMDEATLRRIFDPFFTTKEPGKGTGLGLSTVYGIIKQHQGWIEVESEPGRGTTFRVFLPSVSQQPTEAPPLATATARTPTETILLVEDETTLRQLAHLLLEDLGYKVIDAASGEQALQVWAEHKEKIEALLTDLVMPDGFTGFELADRLQRDRPQLKIIFTSGYGAEEVKKSLPPGRSFQFVQKPYQAESLGRAVRACLDGP